MSSYYLQSILYVYHLRCELYSSGCLIMMIVEPRIRSTIFGIWSYNLGCIWLSIVLRNTNVWFLQSPEWFWAWSWMTLSGYMYMNMTLRTVMGNFEDMSRCHDERGYLMVMGNFGKWSQLITNDLRCGPECLWRWFLVLDGHGWLLGWLKETLGVLLWVVMTDFESGYGRLWAWFWVVLKESLCLSERS